MQSSALHTHKAGLGSGLSVPPRSPPAAEHVLRELGFSAVLLEVTPGDCRWQNITYADSHSSLLQQRPSKCVSESNICMKYVNRGEAEKHLCVFCSFDVCTAVAEVPRESQPLGGSCCRRTQLVDRTSPGEGRGGADEVSSARSWPPPRRNRRAVTTSGFSGPACANDVRDAGLALSLSPAATRRAPLTAQDAGARTGQLGFGSVLLCSDIPTTARH